MATLHTTRSDASLTAGQIVRSAQNLLKTITDWNDSRLTRKALSNLSDRELDDIGLTRSDIADF